MKPAPLADILHRIWNYLKAYAHSAGPCYRDVVFVVVVVGCVVVFVGVVAAVVAVVFFGRVFVAFVVARKCCCSRRAFCHCCLPFSASCSSRVPSLAALKDIDCILFGGLLGCRLFAWVLVGAPELLGGPFGGSQAFPEGSWVPLGGLGRLLGGAWAGCCCWLCCYFRWCSRCRCRCRTL